MRVVIQIHAMASHTYRSRLIFLGLLVALSARARWAAAECNVCQTNGAACVNLTSFHLCYGGEVPQTDQVFSCLDGLECTDLPSICFQSSTRPASCGDTSTCGVCNANQVFACTSRTTFALCFGALTTSDVVGTCPDGMICDASTQNICVAELTESSIVCDADAQVNTLGYNDNDSDYT